MPVRTDTFELQFPLGGWRKRGPYPRIGKFFTPASLNVVPDDTQEGRERGGNRPGLAKHFAQQIGSGNPVRCIHDLRYTSSGSLRNIVLAIANGELWHDRTTPGTLAQLSTSLTFASDRRIQATDLLQKAYFADHGANLASGTDGIVTGTVTFTNTGATNFASAGVNANDHVVEITSHTAINEVQTVTISATGGTFKLFYGSYTTALAYNAAAATVEAALRLLAAINGAHVSVSGSAGGPYTVTFSGDLAATDVALMQGDASGLTGGSQTVTIVETTKGQSTVAGAGIYRIATVITTTITFHASDTAFALTGATFRVLRGPKVYDPAVNTLAIHKSTAGLGHVPVGCSIVARWNGRILYAGDPNNPHVLFASRQGVPNDWDVAAEDQGTAFADSPNEPGVIPDPITALIPHANGCLIIGCSDSLRVYRGDPAAGGSARELSNSVGIFSKTSWCHTPEMHLYFLSLDGLYFMQEGCGSIPVPVSRPLLPEELLNLDPTLVNVEMAYCQRYRGIWLTISKNDSSATTHYWLKVSSSLTADNVQATAAFFPCTFPTNCDPQSMCVRRAYPSNKSRVLMGGRNGYLRNTDHTVYTDDGTNFSSYIAFGPFALGDGLDTDGVFAELLAVLDGTSGDVDWSVYTADTAEEAAAMSGTPATGEWNTAGLTHRSYPRKRGRFAVVKIANGENGAFWAIEQLIVRRELGGRV